MKVPARANTDLDLKKHRGGSTLGRHEHANRQNAKPGRRTVCALFKQKVLLLNSEGTTVSTTLAGPWAAQVVGDKAGLGRSAFGRYRRPSGERRGLGRTRTLAP